MVCDPWLGKLLSSGSVVGNLVSCVPVCGSEVTALHLLRSGSGLSAMTHLERCLVASGLHRLTFRDAVPSSARCQGDSPTQFPNCRRNPACFVAYHQHRYLGRQLVPGVSFQVSFQVVSLSVLHVDQPSQHCQN